MKKKPYFRAQAQGDLKLTWNVLCTFDQTIYTTFYGKFARRDAIKKVRSLNRRAKEIRRMVTVLEIAPEE